MDNSWNNNGDDDDQKKFKQNWPDWLPFDWCIHRNIDSSDTQLYYSNPRGRKFHSQKEVIQYLANQPVKRVTVRTKRKINKLHVRKNKSIADIAPRYLANPPQEWPEWLPQDWTIERSSENPTNVYYCNPKWKRFRTKEEVLHHIDTNSKKLRKKKIHESKGLGVYQQ